MAGITQQEFERALTGFIRELAGARGGRRIRSNTLLFNDGTIDSMKILDLIAFVEVTLGIRIPDRKVRLENFRNVQAISRCFWNDRRKHGKS